MHEFKLIQNIFTIILDTANSNALRSVKKVTLQVGKLRQLAPEFLRFAFAIVSKDTIADGAELEVQHIPVTMKCGSCSQQSAIEEDYYLCPTCQSTDLEVLSGKELIIASIEGEK